MCLLRMSVLRSNLHGRVCVKMSTDIIVKSGRGNMGELMAVG